MVALVVLAILATVLLFGSVVIRDCKMHSTSVFCYACNRKFDKDIPHKVEPREFEEPRGYGGYEVGYCRDMANVYECPNCGNEEVRRRH